MNNKDVVFAKDTFGWGLLLFFLTMLIVTLLTVIILVDWADEDPTKFVVLCLLFIEVSLIMRYVDLIPETSVKKRKMFREEVKDTAICILGFCILIAWLFCLCVLMIDYPWGDLSNIPLTLTLLVIAGLVGNNTITTFIKINKAEQEA